MHPIPSAGFGIEGYRLDGWESEIVGCAVVVGERGVCGKVSMFVLL